MSAAPLDAGLAPGLVLSGGYVLRVTALDPVTGDTVTDVIVSDVSLQVDSAAPPSETIALPPLSSIYTYGGAV